METAAQPGEEGAFIKHTSLPTTHYSFGRTGVCLNATNSACLPDGFTTNLPHGWNGPTLPWVNIIVTSTKPNNPLKPRVFLFFPLFFYLCCIDKYFFLKALIFEFKFTHIKLRSWILNKSELAELLRLFFHWLWNLHEELSQGERPSASGISLHPRKQLLWKCRSQPPPPGSPLSVMISQFISVHQTNLHELDFVLIPWEGTKVRCPT